MKRAFLIAILLAACGGREPARTPPAPPPKPVALDTAPVPHPAEGAPAKPPALPPIDRDLPALAEGKTLHVLFTFNSTGYFLYRGDTLGYEYELLSAFAREHNLHLQPVVVRDSRELFDKLNSGAGDVVAAQLGATTNQSEVALTAGLYETTPVVVQRGSENAAAGTTPTVAKSIQREDRAGGPEPITIKARLIKSPQELAGERVHVPRTSPYLRRLLELREELSEDIEVVEVDESSDRLIQRLAEGEIAYTVAAENLASLKAGEYTNLVVKPAIGPAQPVVWAVRRNAPQLLAALNQFIAAKRKAGLLAVLYRKYFLDRRGFQRRGGNLTAETGILSPFDDAFREYAKIPGWDWRLVAAQAYQESRFDVRARSWAGATGLMQLMPRTARELRVNPADPRQSVEGACRYLWKLDDSWKDSVTNEDERIKFILASYNVGLAHVQDAVALARKYGDDPTSWDDVAYWLIRKSKRSVYQDPVVKHGYARGTEPVTYVDQIMARFENYRQFVGDNPPHAEPLGPEPHN